MKVAATSWMPGGLRLFAGVFLLGLAMTPWLTLAAAISHGYQGDSNLVVGTLVAQSNDDKSRVVAADNKRPDSLIGVVVENRTSTLEITDPSDDIQVATSGKTTVIVSDIAGRIKAGDLIAASPIQGVGMKAVVAGKSIGVSQSDAPANGSKTTTVTSTDGKTQTVQISTIPVVLEVAYFVPPAEKSPFPVFIQKFANILAGKPVAIIRVLIATVLVVTAMVVIGVILFSGIRSTLISVGRNPLARGSIFQVLWRILATVLVILIGAFGAAYLVISG
ncbi:MAG TPA: hypothetical protein VF272_03765 [Candidatus Saccharimonadia bacterium]